MSVCVPGGLAQLKVEVADADLLGLERNVDVLRKLGRVVVQVYERAHFGCRLLAASKR